MKRRDFVKAGLGCIGSMAACGDNTSSSIAPESLESEERDSGFHHRGYLGWITDFATRPDMHAAWPSMRLDDALLEDYRRKFGLMRKLGYNEMSVWGLYVSRSWPLDILSAVKPERGALVEQLIDEAHEQGIRVYSGLGVYSWGFEDIIRAHPSLSHDDNPRTMCASDPEAWDWMRRVIDFVFDRFAIDGVSMQSADQGRCTCRQCRVYSDAEYHALLDGRVSEYIREQDETKTIAVNTWGLKLEDPENLPALLEIGKAADYIIDTHDTTRRRDPGHRERIIESLDCSFGTIGGAQVEPPQHWNRDRWFLPTCRRQGEHLAELYAEGGRACEYFFHILDNPGDEISFRVTGKLLSEPETPWRDHLQSVLAELYETSTESARYELTELVVRAEHAYFRFLPDSLAGTISMEPLVSDEPGPPVYLTKRLSKQQRAEYSETVEGLADEFENLEPEVGANEKLTRTVTCLRNAARDAGVAS